VRARAPSKQDKNKQKETEDEVFCFFLRTFDLLFTSKPIHELRLDQTVANTVIALTIRVI